MAHHQTRLTLFTLGFVTVAVMLMPSTRGVAQAVAPTTIELSAQTAITSEGEKTQKPSQPKSIQRNGIRVQPKQNLQQQQQRTVQPRQQLNIQRQQTDAPQIRKLQQNKPVGVQRQPDIRIQKKVIVAPRDAGRKQFVGQPRKFTPKHDNLVYKFKLRGAKQAFVRGKNYSVFHNNYRVRHNGRFRTFVALGLLAPLAIGAATYHPYAYLDVPGDYCEGLTDDGCEMVYSEVETVEGDSIPQCVAYCPWQ